MDSGLAASSRPGMTASVEQLAFRQDISTSPRIPRPSFAIQNPLREQRAQGRPGAGRTHGPRATKSTRQNHRYEPDIRPSLRDGFTAYSALSPGTGVLAPVISALEASADLASASGGQDHTA